MNHHNNHHHSPVLSPDDLKMSREIALLRLKEVKVKEEIDASRRQAEADMRENRLKALELKTAVLRMKASPSKITSSKIATAMVISTTTGTTTTNHNYNNRNINNNNSNAPTITAHDSIVITTDALSDHHQVPSPNVDTNININDYSHRLTLKSPLRQPLSSHQGVDGLNRIHSNSDGHARINEASYSSTDNIPNTNAAATITHSAISTTSPIQPQPLSAEQVSVDDSVVMMTMMMDDRDDDDDSEIMIDDDDDDDGDDYNCDDSCSKHLSTHHISIAYLSIG